MRAEAIVACRNQLGEGATWSSRRGVLHWVDIERGELWSLDPLSGATTTARAPERLGAAVERVGGGFLLALASRFALADEDLGKIETLAAIEPGLGTRLNDGRCDRQGRYVGGTMDDTKPRQPKGAVYRVDADHRVTRLFGDVHVTNSICFSPDGRTMYFADSARKRILAYAYDIETGTPSHPRLFADLANEAGVPDGSTVDAEGCVWNARFGGGCVVRHAPDGREIARVTLAASNATCPAFGGPGLATLYVTTARAALSEEQLAAQTRAGDLFACEPGVAGLAEAAFAG